MYIEHCYDAEVAGNCEVTGTLCLEAAGNCTSEFDPPYQVRAQASEKDGLEGQRSLSVIYIEDSHCLVGFVYEFSAILDL